ncbi:VOC family protein [Brevibacillus migulae]|uniref:VOC family protein n=1 Tax=Brevibacillus migulae TaxID=1644114 RepID=UPI00106EA60A|nr:VOC family protein [Brevibacillus migulae]
MRQFIQGLDHIQIAAPPGSEDAARHFFGEILGMPELPKPELLRKRGGVWFQCGQQSLHIGIEELFSPAKKAHPAFWVNGLEQLIERLEQYQVRVRRDEAIPEINRCFVEDPFGNRIELMERRS